LSVLVFGRNADHAHRDGALLDVLLAVNVNEQQEREDEGNRLQPEVGGEGVAQKAEEGGVGRRHTSLSRTSGGSSSTLEMRSWSALGMGLGSRRVKGPGSGEESSASPRFRNGGGVSLTREVLGRTLTGASSATSSGGGPLRLTR